MRFLVRVQMSPTKLEISTTVTSQKSNLKRSTLEKTRPTERDGFYNVPVGVLFSVVAPLHSEDSVANTDSCIRFLVTSP